MNRGSNSNVWNQGKSSLQQIRRGNQWWYTLLNLFPRTWSSAAKSRSRCDSVEICAEDASRRIRVYMGDDEKGCCTTPQAIALATTVADETTLEESNLFFRDISALNTLGMGYGFPLLGEKLAVCNSEGCTFPILSVEFGAQHLGQGLLVLPSHQEGIAARPSHEL